MSLAPPAFAGSSLEGVDFSWLAVDAEGHVAWLVTFGSAVVPPWVEASAADFADIEEVLARLPERGRCVAEGSDRHEEEWFAAARKGLYAYDWNVHSGPYRLLAAPESPIQLEALPLVLSSLAWRSRFSQLRFRQTPNLTEQHVLACEHPPRGC